MGAGVPGATGLGIVDGAADPVGDSDKVMVEEIAVSICATKLIGEALCVGLSNHAETSNAVIRCSSATHPDLMARNEIDIVILCYSAVTLESLRRVQELRAGRDRPRTVLLLSRVDREILGTAIEWAVDGCLFDSTSLDELREALARIHSGHSVFAPDLALRAMAEPPRPLRASPLAPRELEVLQVIATGASTDVAAARLGITIHTVRAHLKNAMAKLHAHSKTEAILIALKSGYVVLSD
jgi:DNA-binding NarL/FixJ family response regulator